MGDSRRLQVMDAAAARLALATVMLNGVVRTKPTGLTVHRFRKRPVQVEGLPVQLVYFRGDPEPIRRATRVLDWGMLLAVESIAKVVSGTPPDDTVDPLLNWASHALMSDETLGFTNGTVGPITPQGIGDPDLDDAEHATVSVVSLFKIEYRTKDNDPEAAP